MAKIKIKDLPKGQKISKEELRNIKGGYSFFSASPMQIPYKANTSLIRSMQTIRNPISDYADTW